MMRAINYSLLLVACILITPCASHGFKFDIWESGVSLNAAKQIGIQKNFNLITDTKSHDLENDVLSNSMHYFDKIFNENARITITFTHTSNLLYKVSISWDNLNSIAANRLTSNLHKTLTEKYGILNKSQGSSLIIRNGKRCDGKATSYKRTDGTDRIYLSQSDCFNSVTLNYINSDLQRVHSQEASNENKISAGDANKL